MAEKKGTQQYVGRIGHQISRFGGMCQDVDPGAIPTGPLFRFRNMINARISNGVVVERGGQEKVNSSPFSGCVDGIFQPEYQFPDDTSAITLFHGGANTGIASGNGTLWKWQVGDSSLFYYNTTLADPVDDFAISDSNTVFITVRNGGSTKLYELVLETSGALTNGAHAVASATLRGTITSGVVSFSSCCMLGTDVYVVHGATVAGNSKVYKWDGSSFTLQDSPNISGGLLIRPAFDGALLVMPTGAISTGFTVRRRTSGGTWGDITLLRRILAYDVSDLGSATYIGTIYDNGGGNPSGIFKYDGSAITFVHDTGESGKKVCLETMNDTLYYLHGSGDAIIGSYDGVTFTDTVKDVSAQFSIAGGNAGLKELSGNLIVMTTDGSAKYSLYRSPGSTISGTWTKDFTDTLDSADGTFTLERLQSVAGI